MHPTIHAQRTPAKAACIMAGSGDILTYSDLDARSNQGAHLVSMNCRDTPPAKTL
jgi:long-chain acyl-CoA synthetase